MRSHREITADRRLLTARSTAKPAGWKCVFCATLRLQKDVVDLSTAREFACAPAAFRWRFTRNKGQGLPTVATFCNNGHDERSQTVLAPSFPSRREVGDQCSDPAARCFGPSGAGVSRSAHPRSSVVSGRHRERVHGPSRTRFSKARLREGAEDLCPKKGVSPSMSFLELSWRVRVSCTQCPQLCGELVNRGGASPS